MKLTQFSQNSLTVFSIPDPSNKACTPIRIKVSWDERGVETWNVHARLMALANLGETQGEGWSFKISARNSP
jgi:hypothetical protein